MEQDEEKRKEAKRASQRKYYEKHKEYHKEKRRRFMEQNPEKQAQYTKSYYETHKPERIAQAKVRTKMRLIKRRLEAFHLLGGICCQCGYSDPRALEIDHVNGGGGVEHKALNNVGAYLRGVKTSAELLEGKYQLLCANCHAIKHCSALWQDFM